MTISFLAISFSAHKHRTQPSSRVCLLITFIFQHSSTHFDGGCSPLSNLNSYKREEDNEGEEDREEDGGVDERETDREMERRGRARERHMIHAVGICFGTCCSEDIVFKTSATRPLYMYFNPGNMSQPQSNRPHLSRELPHST